ncbi:MAG TPA: DUF1501 domain-containing protein [Acidimicrobiales bacterium]|nr:DUF1501 domain-containing protein [Acidimicrobiales bacterium]
MAGPTIERRKFLAGALGVGAIGALHRPLRLAARRAPVPAAPAPYPGGSNRILVLLTLYGGHDALTSVVPYGDPAYVATRGALAVPQSTLLPIGQGFGLHPALGGMKALWDAGQMAVVRGVGYPDPNYSHFESMDIWQSGDPSGDLSSGWIGRYLDRTPSDAMKSLWLGSNVPLAFVGKEKKASSILANSSPTAQVPAVGAELRGLYGLLERAHRFDTKLQRAVAYSATDMLAVSRSVAATLQHAPGVSQNFPAAAGSFGTEMGVVAQLIAAGLPTQVYGVSLNGFDSHAGEVASYAALLKQLDAGISGFFKSLQGSPQAAETVLLVYTEFGRRVAPNASGGTDHGSGNSAFVLGPSVKGGLYGEQPSLTQLDSNASLVVTTDYRSLYATVLEQVLDTDPTAILGASYPTIAFL